MPSIKSHRLLLASLLILIFPAASRAHDVVAELPDAVMPAHSQPDREAIALGILLGQVEGHLDVGVALYRDGMLQAAMSHMKHPSDELYRRIEPGLVKRTIPGFAGELETLSKAVAADAGLDDVERAHAAVMASLRAANQALAPATDPQAKAFQTLEIVAGLLDEAAEEYSEGVVDGQIAAVHEYQDSLGFTRTAQRALLLAQAAPAGLAPALDEARGLVVDLIAGQWTTLAPSGPLTTTAAPIAAAAARIHALAASRPGVAQ